jgi:hypothetical protein
MKRVRPQERVVRLSGRSSSRRECGECPQIVRLHETSRFRRHGGRAWQSRQIDRVTPAKMQSIKHLISRSISGSNLIRRTDLVACISWSAGQSQYSLTHRFYQFSNMFEG